MVCCDRCMVTETEDYQVLSEIARSRNRSLDDMLRQMRYDKSNLRERAERYSEERLQERGRTRAEYKERLKRHEEQLSYEIIDRVFREEDVDRITERVNRDQLRKELEQKVRELRFQPQELSGEDLEKALAEYIERGELELEQGRIKITPKGARKLASRFLAKILSNLTDCTLGSHTVEETGYSVERSPNSRKYEAGDEYHRIDFEKTFLNSLERETKAGATIRLETEDFRVYDEIHQTRMVAGLIIDESGSMSGDKVNAAINTALALAELIGREPEDLLKVYLFSQQVREIPYYDILNASFVGGSTDIRAALQTFRKRVNHERGDKQAYLITDTEPNTQDGRWIGLNEVAVGVMEEALRYRKAGITLNIIMLDESPKLRELASTIARKNLGRVFFTSPLELSKVIIEDYLTRKKKAIKYTK